MAIKFVEEQPNIKCCENCKFARQNDEWEPDLSCFNPENVAVAKTEGLLGENEDDFLVENLSVCPRFKKG